MSEWAEQTDLDKLKPLSHNYAKFQHNFLQDLVEKLYS